MKILSLNTIHNTFKPRQINKKSFIGADVVSFSSKKYDIEDIVNPTNHCAYCGCKVYSQAQIDSIAKEILQSKSSRLEGKTKSVLEKLEGAKNAHDIAIAKRLENEEQIKFFKNFLDIASKKSYLRGDAIFEQVYKMDKDAAMKVLVKNMLPILKTIDHVSPQNEDKDNNNSDINLVEACYCCNHDLKKGIPFNEFYAIFPSIKNNMPSDKFNYAISAVLDSSNSGILQRISAKSMLKLIERLFMQRKEAANYLDSIDFRIKGCQASIQDSINSCQDEINLKKAEISDLHSKLDALMSDSEYVAMLDRISLCEKFESQNNMLDSLRARRKRTSDSINELRNPKPNKKQQSKMTDEEKAQKLTDLKETLTFLNSQIEEQEKIVSGTQLKISALDEKFPTIDMLQHKKSKKEVIYHAYLSLKSEMEILAQRREERINLADKKSALEADISSMPADSDSFVLESYSQEEQDDYNRYVNLTEAVKYIDEHPNGGTLRTVIHQSAKKSIDEEIAQLEKKQVIIDYNKSIVRKNLENQLAKINKSIEDTDSAIVLGEKNCENFQKTIQGVSFEQVKKEIADLSETIRRLTNKQNLVKIPQRIITLKAEVALLESTISDLLKKAQQIDSSFSVTA